MAKVSDIIGTIVIGASLISAYVVNFFWTFVPPLYQGIIEGLLPISIGGGVGLILTPRVSNLMKEGKSVQLQALIRTRLIHPFASSIITMVRPRKDVSDPNAIVSGLTSGSIATVAGLVFSHFDNNWILQSSRYFLIPDTLLVLGLSLLSLSGVKIFRYQRSGALTYIARSMLAEARSMVSSQEFKARSIIYGFKMGMLIPLFAGLAFIYFICADAALSSGNILSYGLMSATSFGMALMTRNSESGLQVTKSFKLTSSMIFLAGGLVVLLNFGIPAFINIPYTTASGYQHLSFNIVVGGGMLGELTYLLGFYSIGCSYVESKVRRSYLDSGTSYRSESLDKWLAILRSLFGIPPLR